MEYAGEKHRDCVEKNIPCGDYCVLPHFEARELTEQEKAERMFPHHHPLTALVNYQAGREIWDTNGDVW